MPTEGDIILESTRNHIEADSEEYVSICGESFDPDSVDREPYETSDEGWEQSHELFCMACTQAENRRAVQDGGTAGADAE